MAAAVIAPSTTAGAAYSEECTMLRTPSTSSDGSFWTTIELLADRGRRRSAGDADDCATTLDLPKRGASALSFAHPHVRARLEKHMGSNLVSLTDKMYMTDLEDRIREVNEENLNKRISARVMDEMERLKRLILVGKTPLKECPPELYHHPVFVFWRMVNREVARASKKRADAYYRKLKASQKADQLCEEEVENEATEEEGEQLSPEQLLAKCREELEEQKQIDVEKGVRFTDEQFALLKYETNDVKTLKSLSIELEVLVDESVVEEQYRERESFENEYFPLAAAAEELARSLRHQLTQVDLTETASSVSQTSHSPCRHSKTVEELYSLADKIIGTKRL